MAIAGVATHLTRPFRRNLSTFSNCKPCKPVVLRPGLIRTATASAKDCGEFSLEGRRHGLHYTLVNGSAKERANKCIILLYN